MEPLRLDRVRDARIRRLTDFLDGKGIGFDQHTRVRWWNGFGSQVHPTLGILLDSIELGTVLERTGRLKGAAGRSPEEIARRLPYAVDFIVAHEHGHLVQYRMLPRDSVERPELTRVIECSADMIGALTLMYAYLTEAIESDIAAAAETVTDFGHVIGARDWLDGTTHPLPEERRLCIAHGTGLAGALSTLLRARNADLTADSVAARRWLSERAPELIDSVTTMVAWSVRRADSLLATRSVATGSLTLATVRDSALPPFIRRVGAAAVSGHAAFVNLRSVRAPGRRDRHILRIALDAPWECTIGPSGAREEAWCGRIERASASDAEATWAALEQSADSTFAAMGWRREPTPPDDPDLPPELGANRAKVTFRAPASGGRPGAWAELTFSMDSAFSPTAQLPPRYQFGLTFFVARPRND